MSEEFEKRLKSIRRLSPEYIYDLRDMVDDIFAHEDTELVTFETYRPASEMEINTAEDGMGIAVPAQVLSFFSQIANGFELEWTLMEDGERSPGGAINVYNFGKVFGSWLDNIWGVTHPEADADALDFSWELRGLERGTKNESPFITTLHVGEREPTYDVYFHDPMGESYLLNVGFTEYMECLLETLGFHGWQYLVSDVDFDEVPEARERAEAFHKIMPKLFPDTDFSRYRTP